MRRAVVDLAARFPFARALVNTGRMSVANAYPSGPHLPEGACTVQNLALAWQDGRATSIAELLGEGRGSACLGLWFQPRRAQAAAAADLPPQHRRFIAAEFDRQLTETVHQQCQ